MSRGRRLGATQKVEATGALDGEAPKWVSLSSSALCPAPGTSKTLPTGHSSRPLAAEGDLAVRACAEVAPGQGGLTWGGEKRSRWGEPGHCPRQLSCQNTHHRLRASATESSHSSGATMAVPWRGPSLRCCLLLVPSCGGKRASWLWASPMGALTHRSLLKTQPPSKGSS